VTAVTALVVIDPLVPAAARARLRRALGAAAPSAHLIVPDTPLAALDHADAAEVLAALRPSEGLVERATRLRWIHSFGAGVDQFLDAPGVRDGRVVLTRTAGAFTAVPEHVMALVLAFSRRLHVAVRNQTARRWDRPAGVGSEVDGQVLGVLGLGQIGQQLAARAAAFGMRVIGTKRIPAAVPHVERVVPPERMDDVLREADFVVALLPLTPATRGLLGEREFRLMKPTAVFVNVARGPIVQEEALLGALRHGWIAGAGLDVFDREPLPADHPLYAFEQVILTPHVSAATPAVFDKMVSVFAANLRRYIAGDPLLHVVDPARGY